MKKRAPYKSLIEHDPAIDKMKNEKKKIDKPVISNEVAEEINDILQNYNGELLLISIYKNGEVIQKETTIKRIDIYERKLILPDRKSILLKDIVGIQRV